MKKYLFLAVVIVLFTGVSGYSQDNPSDRVEEEDVNIVNSVEQVSPDGGVKGVNVESSSDEVEVSEDAIQTPYKEKVIPEIEETVRPTDVNSDTEADTNDEIQKDNSVIDGLE